MSAKIERLTWSDMEWMRIPEQAVCVCGDQKAVHKRTGSPTCSAHRGCGCPGFLERDTRITWSAFHGRLIVPTKTHPKVARRALALRTAITLAGSDVERMFLPFDTWMASSRRAWRAWQDAGRPTRVAGRAVYHGPVSIPELES